MDCDRCKWSNPQQSSYCFKLRRELTEAEYWNDEYCVMFDDKPLDAAISEKEE